MITKKILQTMVLVMLGQLLTSAANAQGPTPYGTAENPRLGYTGDPFLRNVLIIDGRIEGNYYEDSIRLRSGDSFFRVGPHIWFQRQGKQLTLEFGYQPDFRLYRKTPQLNSVDHGLQFDTNYEVNRRFAVRARGSLLSRRGIFQGNISEESGPTLGSPATLNQTVFRPLVRQFEDALRVDATYQTSRRTSFGVFAGLGQRNFDEEASPGHSLRNTDLKNGGLVYRHRLSPNTTFGITYLLQDLRTGTEIRSLIHTTFLSVAWQLSPGLTLDVFAGPQHTHLHDRPAMTSSFLARWHWALGGGFTKQSENTAFRFRAEREVSDGGGLSGPVTSSFFSLIVRRRLWTRWQSVWSAGYALNDPLIPGLFSSNLRTTTASCGLERSLKKALTAGLGYEYIHQSGIQNSPLGKVNQNRAYLSVFYRFGQIGLGHGQ